MQISRLTAERPEFQEVPLAQAWGEAGLPGSPACTGPHLLLSPAAHGTDGFFCAVLERRG